MAGFKSGRVTTTLRMEAGFYKQFHKTLVDKCLIQNDVIVRLIEKWMAGDVDLSIPASRATDDGVERHVPGANRFGSRGSNVIGRL